MPDLEVNIFNQKLKLSYKENEKQRILHAVEILNNNWNKFSYLHGKVSDLKIATLISLELQDSIEDNKVFKEKLNAEETTNELLKKEIDLKIKEFGSSEQIIKKLQSEINSKNQELSELEHILDKINNELLEIKNNILKKNE